MSFHNESVRLALVLTVFSSTAAMAGEKELAAAGTWDWFNNIVVTLRPDGTAEGTNNEKGKWQPNGKKGIIVTWNAGWVDTLAISDDRNSLDGRNKEGTNVTGRRKIDAIVGEYDWHTGSTIKVEADFSVRGSKGESGFWSVVDASKRAYAIGWKSGQVAHVSLNADGSLLEGVFGRRKSAIDNSLVIGTFQGTHPHWSDTVIISADGTYKRGTGDPGKWTFDGKRLVLNWTNWGPETLEMQGPGTFVAPSNAFRLVKR
ncbi:MAG: hypothetical protein HYV07_18495 [Deltaproteobacteria bacterium]|nr:hypothetical protein [Deltaproteobacteria bacterium]